MSKSLDMEDTQRAEAMRVEMPPEMMVSLRLLGFSGSAVTYFAETYHLAKAHLWTNWVADLERNPEMLRVSTAHYNKKYP